MKIINMCRDYGERPGCLGDPDERYTMRFDDIGEDPIYWCSKCGPEAAAVNEVLHEFMSNAGPEGLKQLNEKLAQAEAEHKARLS